MTSRGAEHGESQRRGRGKGKERGKEEKEKEGGNEEVEEEGDKKKDRQNLIGLRMWPSWYRICQASSVLPPWSMVAHAYHPSTQEAGVGGHKFKTSLNYKPDHVSRKKKWVGLKYLELIIKESQPPT